jgi:transposase
MGNLLSVIIDCANIHDMKSGFLTVVEAFYKYSRLQGFCADMGYRRIFVNDVKQLIDKKVDISERIKPTFEIQPKRWRVELMFSWFNHSRELSKDYAITVNHEENMILLSHMSTILKHITSL